MIRQILKGVAVLLVLTVSTLLFLYLGRTDPWGIIPGKRLVGEEVTEPIEDWSFIRRPASSRLR